MTDLGSYFRMCKRERVQLFLEHRSRSRIWFPSVVKLPLRIDSGWRTLFPAWSRKYKILTRHWSSTKLTLCTETCPRREIRQTVSALLCGSGPQAGCNHSAQWAAILSARSARWLWPFGQTTNPTAYHPWLNGDVARFCPPFSCFPLLRCLTRTETGTSTSRRRREG